MFQLLIITEKTHATLLEWVGIAWSSKQKKCSAVVRWQHEL